MKNHLPVSEFYEDKFESLKYIIDHHEEQLRGWSNKKSPRPIMDVVEPLISADFFFTDYPITVNTNYPDHIIVEEVKKILAKIRSKKGFNNKNKALSRKDLINWASYRLLPYFDLKILEIYEGIKITNSVICSVLYPKGEYGEDNLRKSVEPLMKKVLTQVGFDGADNVTEISIFDALCFLAHTEISENGKKES